LEEQGEKRMKSKALRPAPASKRLDGFTLIELLVVIAVIALLSAITIPAFSSAKEVAKKLVCSSNLHSIGIGLIIYQQEHADRLPPQYDRWGPVTETYDNQYIEPWASYVAYHQDQTDAAGNFKPLQLGYLWDQQNLENPAVFYCASQRSRGDNLPYTYDYYTADGSYEWGTYLPTKANGSPDDKIRVSYHYWLHAESSLVELSNKPVALDNIQHWNSVAHTKNNQPHGVNALFGDGHVSFSNHDDLFELNLWNGGPTAGPWDGPGNSRDLFTAILTRLNP
jgi:prepilin-type N-terminal cleavage/methylation domain-containing protein/prepilin-type processing-associated H-X9-DG protein